MNDECTVTFEGTEGGTYYVACPLVKYLNSKLVNTSNSTIYLYKNIGQGTQSGTISIAPYSYPRYVSNNIYYYITNASNISYNFASSFYREFDVVEIVLLSLIVVISLINRLLGGTR